MTARRKQPLRSKNDLTKAAIKLQVKGQNIMRTYTVALKIFTCQGGRAWRSTLRWCAGLR